jgi:hypothetical protein
MVTSICSVPIYGDFRKSYTLLGILFLSATVMSLAIDLGDDHVWNAGLRARWAVFDGYTTVFIINASVWTAGRQCFQTQATGHRSLFSFCAMAFVPLAFAAFITDSEQNRINRFELDVRRPEAYRAANPGAIKAFDDPSRENLQADIGQDLRTLSRDPDFHDALQNGIFYKQPWDEPFQLLHRSVMFGYRPKSSSDARSPFVIIRFPRELAEALRFQPINSGP